MKVLFFGHSYQEYLTILGFLDIIRSYTLLYFCLFRLYDSTSD